MNLLQQLGTINIVVSNLKNQRRILGGFFKLIYPNTERKDLFDRRFSKSCLLNNEYKPRALRNLKPKSVTKNIQYFVDIRQIRTIGGKGGDGSISFLSLYLNEFAGPAGGDGGNGGHVIFKVSENVKDLKAINAINQAEHGTPGKNDNCTGKNAKHLILDVPIGTIIRNIDGQILADLNKVGMMFVAARGGGGGHGNAYFKSAERQAPNISEYGADGENIQYVLEIRSMAHIGLIGFPNAGKSTLLRSMTRARPKVAAYPFTTLHPNLGTIEYDDYEQIVVADLPGLIPDSHKNRGLGVTFLKHVERCAVLLFMIDLSVDNPWEQFEILQYEIQQFNKQLKDRSIIVVANKMDLPEAKENLELLKEKINLPIIPISAKYGKNVSNLLSDIRELYDKVEMDKSKKEVEDVCK